MINQSMQIKKKRIVVLGAGIRGLHLAKQISEVPDLAEIVGVAEPNNQRRQAFAELYHLPSKSQFTSWERLLSDGSLEFDAIIVATLDNQHAASVLAGVRRGCHLLVEKPLADTLEDCLAIKRAQMNSKLVISVCHTLRYMDAFKQIKQVVTEGQLGVLIHVDHMEAIDHLRFTHNYVRGRWAKETNNTFLLLHKCSHDIDFIAWLIDQPCRRVASFGSLAYFNPSHAPEKSGTRCLLDCQIESTCPYSARRLYVDTCLTGNPKDMGENSTPSTRLDAVKTGPFGVCVWRAGNDVVDHQIVSMEFKTGTTATCTLTGYSASHGRRTRLQGTLGELIFDEALDLITIKKFTDQESKTIKIQRPNSYHPEDQSIVRNWLFAINDSTQNVEVDACEAIKTHAIVFAAERSRKENRIIELEEEMVEEEMGSGDNS